MERCPFWRKVDQSGQVECSFVMARSRTVASPCVTVPRLELHASVVAAGIDGFQNNPSIHTERDTAIQDGYGKHGDGDHGFLKARTVETRPGKDSPAKGPRWPVLPSEHATVLWA